MVLRSAILAELAAYPGSPGGADTAASEDALAYLCGARLLVDHHERAAGTFDVTRPAFLLQQRATELVLKRLLRRVHQLASLRAARGESTAPTVRESERLNRSHDLVRLHDDLCRISDRHHLERPPAQLHGLVAATASLEALVAGHREAVASGVRLPGRPADRGSGPSDTASSVGRLQAQLEAVASSVLRWSGSDLAATYEGRLHADCRLDAREQAR